MSCELWLKLNCLFCSVTRVSTIYRTFLQILSQEKFPKHDYLSKITSKKQLHWYSYKTVYSFSCFNALLIGINFILTTLPYSKIVHLLASLSWSVIFTGNVKNHEAQINYVGFTRMALAFPEEQSSHFLVQRDIPSLQPWGFAEYIHWFLISVLRSWGVTIFPCRLFTMLLPGCHTWRPQGSTARSGR